MKQYRSTTKTFTVAIMSSLGSIVQGIHMNYMNTNSDQYTNDSLMKGLLSSSLTFGAAAGSMLTYLLIQYKRRALFLLTDILNLLGGLLTLLGYVLLGRTIQGISLGMNIPLNAVYLRETVPVELYGRAANFHAELLSLGSLMTYLFSYYEIPYLELGPLILSLSRLLYFLIIYPNDTVPYYLKRGMTQEARYLIAYHYHPKFWLKIEQDTTQYVEQPKPKGSGERLFLALTLNIIQQLSGINVVIFYSMTIFQTIYDWNSSLQLNIWYSILNIISISIIRLIVYYSTSYVGQLTGRKPLLQYGMGICMLSNFMIGISLFGEYSQTTAKVVIPLIFVYLIGFWLSLGATVGVYTPEIVPEKGVALCVSVQWAFAGIVTLLFPVLKDLIGLGSCFIMYGGFCLLGYTIVSIWAVETKGLTPYQVDSAFRLNKKSD